jgi:hypothetical protein
VIPIQPFRALRPSAARAREFSVPRLDHLADPDLRSIASRLPRSLAAVLGDGGCDLLEELEQAKALLRHAAPTFYMHRHVNGPVRAAGLVACLPIDAFAQGRVRSHRAACDRRGAAWRAQVDRLGAQVDPVIVAFEPTEEIRDLFEREMNERPLFHVVADDGATHTLWSGTRAPALQRAFAAVSHAYLLEGHHRVAASASGWVSALLLPMSEVHARWSARTLSGEAGVRASAWLAQRGERVEPAGAPPEGFVDACIAEAGGVRWVRVALPTGASHHDARLDHLLVACAGETGRRLPGEHRADRLGAAMGELGASVALLLPPPPMEEIRRLADAGERLPVGSTWFEPRVRSGLWIAGVDPSA